MIKEIFDQLIADIKAGVTELELVEQYNGEFEEGTDWNPRASACFIQLTGYKPVVKHSDGSSGKSQVIFKIYTGANKKQNKSAMDITEGVIELLNGSKLTIESSGKTYIMTIMAEGMDFISYQQGFEAYVFSLSVV